MEPGFQPSYGRRRGASISASIARWSERGCATRRTCPAQISPPRLSRSGGSNTLVEDNWIAERRRRPIQLQKLGVCGSVVPRWAGSAALLLGCVVLGGWILDR